MNLTATPDMAKHSLFAGLMSIGLVTFGFSAAGQGLVNDNAKISIAASTFLIVDGGGFTNSGAGGQVTNAGTFEVDGDWENNSATSVFGVGPTSLTGGTVILDGGPQDIQGSNPTNFYNLIAGGAGFANRKFLNGVDANVYGQVTLTTGIDLNTRVLTLENGNTNAILGAGPVVAETPPLSGYGYLSWKIGTTATGNYAIPFANATGVSIPLIYNITVAGTPNSPVSDYKRFSTYPTPLWDNLPVPVVPGDNPLAPVHIPHLTNAAQSIPSQAMSANADRIVDRFWIIDDDIQGNYDIDVTNYIGDQLVTNDYPKVTLTFNIQNTDWNAAGNVIAAGSMLAAQRFNHVDADNLNPFNGTTGGGIWGDWLYSPVSTAGSGAVTLQLTRIEDFFPIWTLVDNSDPLPIELARFVGQCQDGGIEVSWTTYTETNNDFFTLERSKNGVDFEVVDVIAGAGNSNSPITYQVLDQESYGGTSYYRLKSTDIYGEEEYSQVIAMTCGEELTDFTFVNAYEIDNTDLLVEFTAAENERYTVTLFDASGRIVYNHGSKAIDGMNKVRLPVGNLAHGIYIINLQNDARRFSKKVMMK
ncbi:MAG: T9SS type A sorting domain-containing protein [Flavobacteriales bacterium]|nr:T9SS type A sorting domain-containing protein [Flavobacteriales bacterium]